MQPDYNLSPHLFPLHNIPLASIDQKKDVALQPYDKNMQPGYNLSPHLFLFHNIPLASIEQKKNFALQPYDKNIQPGYNFFGSLSRKNNTILN